MFKNLSAGALGVSGRQSELIELALTYGFRGFDIDIEDFHHRAVTRGMDQARQYIDSAKIKIGTFMLPTRWQGDESEYQADLEKLKKVAEAASVIKATRCITNVMPASDEKSYQENFEFHRKRLAEIAEVLNAQQIRLGLGFLAPTSYRANKEFKFIHQAEALLVLIKTIGSPNVGLALDLWHWRVGGGGMDQLSELSSDQIVSVRLADVPAEADLALIDEKQRLLPGTTPNSISGQVVSLLKEIGYAGPLTAFPHASQFSGKTRDAIVQRASESLEKLLKPPVVVEPEAVAAAAED